MNENNTEAVNEAVNESAVKERAYQPFWTEPSEHYYACPSADKGFASREEWLAYCKKREECYKNLGKGMWNYWLYQPLAVLEEYVKAVEDAKNGVYHSDWERDYAKNTSETPDPRVSAYLRELVGEYGKKNGKKSASAKKDEPKDEVKERIKQMKKAESDAKKAVAAEKRYEKAMAVYGGGFFAEASAAS